MSDRVLTVADARELVRTLYERVPVAAAPVESTMCDALDPNDPVFAGLRARYAEFDEWWAKAVCERRRAWVVRAPSGDLAALCVIAEKAPGKHGLRGKVLKLCTFKVADEHSGYRYGELLLNTVFDFAEANNYDTLYVEVDPQLEVLLGFLETFGFFDTGLKKPNGDLIMVKRRRPSSSDLRSMTALELHVQFGPPAVMTKGVNAWLIPIQPRYHARLFPGAEKQTTLLAGQEAHGNSIRKAYLCKAAVRSMEVGDLLYFYKSVEQAVGVVGIVEDINVLSRAEDIVSAAGKRTVYAAAEIAEMAVDEQEILVIGFRQVRVAPQPVSYRRLVDQGLVAGPPQTAQGVPQEGAAWLAQQMGL